MESNDLVSVIVWHKHWQVLVILYSDNMQTSVSACSRPICYSFNNALYSSMLFLQLECMELLVDDVQFILLSKSKHNT
jgi:hypothetical protein